jgi:outer membrane lipoprotein-sorting protein
MQMNRIRGEKNMSFVSALFAVLSLALFNAAALGASLPVPTVEYSADRQIETEKGTMTQKVYHAAGKERAEMQMGGMSSAMILRQDKKIAWMLMPAQKMYNEMDLGQARQNMGPVSPGENPEITIAGKETVEGFETTKYKLVTADKKYGGFMWFTAEGIAIKMDLLSREDAGKKSRMTMTLKNLKIGDQDDALFEVPAGYTKMPSFGGMNMPKMPGT